MNRAFDFATVGFRPYPETEEFVTLAVIALDTAAEEFGFHMLPRNKVGRVKKMFPRIPDGLFHQAWETLRAELESTRDMITFKVIPAFDLEPRHAGKDGGRDQQGLFKALTTPRDGVFNYPIKGRRLGATMDEVLAFLKARYVDQTALPGHQPVEAAMAKTIFAALKSAGYAPYYQKDVPVGPPQYRVNFTFGQPQGDHRAVRVIRPLNFTGKTPTAIFQHADEWLTKMNRLKNLDFLPAHCLFTFRPPAGGEEREAFNQIHQEFLDRRAVMAEENDLDAVLKFAKPEELGLFRMG